MDPPVIKNHFDPSIPYFFPIGTIILVILCLIYLWFVFYKGPRLMKHKEPCNIINLIRSYNIFQFLACTIFVTNSYVIGFDFRFLWRCQKFYFLSDSDRFQLIYGSWLFLALRLFEFIETVFFILRKKESQASFLHVYHHISTVCLIWFWICYEETEWSAVYVCLINSFVHMIMYVYYLLSSFKSTRKFLFFVKPIITIGQMAQFILIMGHCIVQVLSDCESGIFFYLQIVNLFILFCLFGHFFITEYFKNKNSVDLQKINTKY